MADAVRFGPGRATHRGRWWWVALGATLTLACVALTVWCALRANGYPVGDLARSVPRRTALMSQRAAEAARKSRTLRIDQRWVPYERISPLLRRAVLVAEDDAFFAHGGLDWNEINASVRRNLELHRVARGGSTITQQLARNLFLGDERTITRKLTEAFLAMRLERALGKRRIFELYLNLIEWGDGVYGIEAAARRYFGVPAAALGARQSVLLAAVIINPRRYSVLAPARRIERRARMIAGRLRRRGAIDAAQYDEAIAKPVMTGLPPLGSALPTNADSVPGDPVPAEASAESVPVGASSDSVPPTP